MRSKRGERGRPDHGVAVAARALEQRQAGWAQGGQRFDGGKAAMPGFIAQRGVSAAAIAGALPRACARDAYRRERRGAGEQRGAV